VLLVSAIMAALVGAGANLPGPGLVHSISRQMLCAVSLGGGCGSADTLEAAYGNRLAETIREQAPELLYGRDMLGLPVDYRTCRSAYCAEGPGEGVISESEAGEPVTLFTRVIDCREGSDPSLPRAECSDDRVGRLYLQYWAYYPQSASLRGAPVLEEEGFHPNDWESVQVRMDADGSVSQRASSHGGHNHTRSKANWGSDMGWGWLSGLAEKVGVREAGGWGESSGQYLIAGGSHAGNVADPDRSEDTYPSRTPAGRIRLVPLERARGDALSRAASFDPITPPWEKKLWLDPEEEGTG